MTNHREILRLYSLGLNKSQIAQSLGCSRTTVIQVLSVAEEKGISYHLPEDLSDRKLSELLFPSDRSKPEYKMPDYEYVHKELQKSGVTLNLLWLEYCEKFREEGELPYQLTQFKKHYRDYAVKTNATYARLILFKDHRIEFSITITGNVNIDFSEACFQRLAAVTVSTIVGIFVLVIVPAVSELFIKLSVKPVFHKLRYCFLEQFLNIVHTPDIAFFEQFSDFCPSCFFFRASVPSFSHFLFLLCIKPPLWFLLYTTSEVYTIFGTVSISFI